MLFRSLSVVTILVHEFAPYIDGDANEDCAVQARWFEVHYEPFFSRDCVVEASYQVAEIGACDLLDRSLISV